MGTVATDRPFTEEQQRALVAFAGAVIPASAEHGVPGADDPTIAADILATAGRHREAVAATLALHERMANARYGASFADLDSTARCTLAEGACRAGFYKELDAQDEAAQAAAQRTLTSIVVQCYYRDDRVMLSLGMDARPPFPEGFEVQESDWSLLDPVKRRGKIYRDADG